MTIFDVHNFSWQEKKNKKGRASPKVETRVNSQEYVAKSKNSK